MKYDLFVSDFDGTLGIAPGNIDAETVETVKEYVKRGGKFVICTGRMYTSIRDICLRYGLEGLVISYQGAMINDIKTGDSIFMGGIDYPLAGEVAEKLLAEGIQTVVDIDDILYYEQSSPYTEFYEKAVHITGKKVKSLIELVNSEKKPVQKVGGICDPETAKRLTEKYSEIYKDKLIINNGSSQLIEVINPACSKGFAVKFLSDYYNVPMDRIITVGDSTNDIELVRGAWHGVAVGDARAELKAVAKEITVPYKEKPVKVLLEKYCL